MEGTSDTIGATCRLTIEVGGAVRISAATLSQFGVSEDRPFDLAVIGTTLYMVGWSNAVLYSLNIDSTDTTPDGSAIQVGSLTGGFGVGENLPSGLAAIGNTLYMVGRRNIALYTLNIDRDDTIADGSADQVGGLAAGFGVAETNPSGLAAIGNTLYMVGEGRARLYSLSTTDGSAIQVGSLALADRFGIAESIPSGLAAIENTLYMVGWNTDALYALRYQ